MGRLVVRITTNKEPMSALAGIKRLRRFLVFSTAGSNYLILVVFNIRN